MTHLI